jgi:hypothetical protein
MTGARVAAAGEDKRESITLSPVSRHYTFDAGTTKKDTMTIVNDGEVAYSFTVYASPYSVTGEQYEPDFFTTKTTTDLKSWVSFAQKTYSLKPGATVEVPYTITVPEDATPGGHYAVIFAETQPSDQKKDVNSVERKKRVGMLLYTTVNGTFETGGTFNGIHTSGLQFKPPLRSELNLENTGSSDFAVDTVFAVSDIFGKRKYTETKTYQMLPKTKRKVQLAWDKSPGFGLYQVTVSAKFLDKQTSNTSYVLMAPIAFYMIFVIGVLVAVIYFVQKRR